MTTPSDAERSPTVTESRAHTAAAACRDACREAAGGLPDSESGKASLLNECASRCDAVVTALDGQGHVDEETITACAAAAFACAHELGDAPAFQAVVKQCEQLVPLLQTLNAPTPTQDKVVADTFPASDPPAH